MRDSDGQSDDEMFADILGRSQRRFRNPLRVPRESRTVTRTGCLWQAAIFMTGVGLLYVVVSAITGDWGGEVMFLFLGMLIWGLLLLVGLLIARLTR